MIDLLKWYADNLNAALDNHPIVTTEARPKIEGLYAVEIHFGWKLLEWHAGAWWHMERVGRWMAGDPVQWVGPLPERMLIKGKKGQKPERKVFDL